MELSKKVAVVTGAEGAIGSRLATLLSDMGVEVIRVDKCMEYGCDFTDLESVNVLAKRISLDYPRIDFLFNVAGIGIYKSIENLTLDEWINTFSINVTSPFVLVKNLQENLKKSNSPMVFNIGSGMGVVGADGRSSYCSSKFALRGFSLSASLELKKYGIDVCLLTLGSVMTPFGTGGIDKRKELERTGKKYLTVDEVVAKIIEITKNENREFEYVFYPEGYM